MRLAIFRRSAGALRFSRTSGSSRTYREPTTFAERRSTKPGSLSLLHDLGWLGAAQNARKRKRPPTALLFLRGVGRTLLSARCF